MCFCYERVRAVWGQQQLVDAMISTPHLWPKRPGKLAPLPDYSLITWALNPRAAHVSTRTPELLQKWWVHTLSRPKVADTPDPKPCIQEPHYLLRNTFLCWCCPGSDWQPNNPERASRREQGDDSRPQLCFFYQSEASCVLLSSLPPSYNPSPTPRPLEGPQAATGGSEFSFILFSERKPDAFSFLDILPKGWSVWAETAKLQEFKI